MAIARRTLGQEVRRLRLERGMTLRQMAEQTGIPEPTLSRLENDRHRKRGPQEYVLRRVAEALASTPEDAEKLFAYFRTLQAELIGYWGPDSQPAGPIHLSQDGLVDIQDMPTKEAVAWVLRQKKWPPHNVALVMQAVELFRPNSSDEPARVRVA